MKVRPTGVVRMGRFTCLTTVATTTTTTDNNNSKIPKTSDVQILTRTTTAATAATTVPRVTSMAVVHRSTIDQTSGSGPELQIDLAQLPGNFIPIFIRIWFIVF